MAATRRRLPALAGLAVLAAICAAKRYRTADASDPETWSTPVTGYGEFEGLRLPTRAKALYKLPGGDYEYIEVTLTELHYDTGAPNPPTTPSTSPRSWRPPRPATTTSSPASW